MKKEVEINTRAWYGDVPKSFAFPSAWDVVVAGGCDLPALTHQQMKAGMRNPIGSPSLLELAAGKRRVAVIVDDITRPTPAEAILPILFEELQEAGVDSDSVTIVIGGGTHHPSSEEEIQKKIGKEFAAKTNVISHDSRNGLVYLGKSTRGTPLFVNQKVMDSDFIIGVGCIYPHPAAGFSGGSKIVAPGVCGSETARCMHDYLKGDDRGKIDERTELRQEIEEIASKVGLGFIVNVLLNQWREVCGIFAGDKVSAHRAGVQFAREIYTVEPVKDADVVIVDVYPFDGNFQFGHDRSLWQFEDLDENVEKVIVASCPAGLGNHDLYPLRNPFLTRLRRRMKNLGLRDFRHSATKIRALKKLLKRKSQRYMILSEGLSDRDIHVIYPKAKLFRTWDNIVEELKSSYKDRSVKIGFYRCSPYLLPATRK